MSMKSCFVVTGFGDRTDFETQRTLDLDRTCCGIDCAFGSAPGARMPGRTRDQLAKLDRLP